MEYLCIERFLHLNDKRGDRQALRFSLRGTSGIATALMALKSSFVSFPMDF